MNQSTWSLYSNQGRYPSLGATMLLFPAYFVGAMSSACSRHSLIAPTKIFCILIPETPLRLKGDFDDYGTNREAEWPTRLSELRRDVENSRGAPSSG